jgi:hypothetical protein
MLIGYACISTKGPAIRPSSPKRNQPVAVFLFAVNWCAKFVSEAKAS